MEICGVYKIVNTVTGDFYIGSSKNIKQRWACHKKSSTWSRCPNNPMYLDFQKYGVDKFDFQILEEAEPDSLKETEQQFIEMLKPTYNSRNADGLDVERRKKYKKEYHRKAQNKYQKTEKYKEYQKTEKYKEHQKESNKKYYNQLCCYNGEALTLGALRMRFKSQGIPHPVKEAKKYLIKKESKTPIEFYDIYP